jgi:pyrroline-5-carboxylate reductase
LPADLSSSPLPPLGFIGTGTIAAAMIEGLAAAGVDSPILVSPRNAETANDLARRFGNVKIAANNQAVLDGSDLVILAVRPQIAGEVLPTLHFRPDHRVLSLIATVSLDWLHSVTAPAAAVARAVPLPPVARRQGPTAVFPADPIVCGLFDRLGTAITLDDESAFDVFTAATAIMGSYFAFAHTITAWMSEEGVAADKAHAFMAQMLKGLAGAASASPGRSFDQLADEHQTRGGINEQVYRAVTEGGVMADLDRALDAVLARLRAGRAK